NLLQSTLLIVLVLFLTACGGTSESSESESNGSEGGSSEGATELRLGHIFPADSVKDQAANMFADRIEEETNGEITVNVYPASQLGGDEVMAQDVSRGTLDMSFINQGSLAGMNKLLDFHYLPYI